MDPPEHLIHRPGASREPSVPEDLSSRSLAAAQCNSALDALRQMLPSDVTLTIPVSSVLPAYSTGQMSSCEALGSSYKRAGGRCGSSSSTPQ